MNISLTPKDDLTATITLSITKEDYQPRVQTVLKEHRKRAQIKGFRPGQAPMSVIERMVGRDLKIKEIDKLVSESLSEYIEKEKIDFLAQPLPSEAQKHIELDKDETHDFLFDIALKPNIELTIDNQTELPYYTIEISEELIEEEITRYKSRVGKQEPAAAVTEVSFLKVDLEQVNEDGSAKEMPILNYNVTISVSVIKDADIKEQFIGLTANAELVVDLKKAYPNDTELSSILNIDKEHIAETEPFFKIRIHEITEYQAGELNAENLEQLFPDGSVTDMDSLRKHIIADYEAYMKENSEYRFETDVREYLKSKTDFELPDKFMKRYLIVTDKSGKINTETVEAEYNSFVDSFKLQLIFDSISHKNNLVVSKEEIREQSKQQIANQFRQYGLTLDMLGDKVEDFINNDLKDKNKANSYSEQVIENKVVAYIKERVSLQHKSITLDEFNKLNEANA